MEKILSREKCIQSLIPADGGLFMREEPTSRTDKNQKGENTRRRLELGARSYGNKAGRVNRSAAFFYMGFKGMISVGATTS